MIPIRVLSVCTSDSFGGAARAAYRIHRAVQSYGIDSKMFVKQKGTTDPTVIPLSDFLPKNLWYRSYDWIRNKVKNKWQHYIWGKYPNRSPYFMSDLRSTDIGDALQRKDYDILHLHWINQRFLPLEALPTDKPIIWTLHDSWPFCGICHYFLECEHYKQQCGECPFLHSGRVNDLSHSMWNKKEEIYKTLDLHIVTPSRWLGDCTRLSSLMGKFPITVVPNCLDTNLYRPLTEQEIPPQWRNLQERRLEKPLLLYGAMNAATDMIKGFTNLLSALKMLEEQGYAGAFELIVFGADRGEIPMDLHIPIHFVGYVTNTQDLVSLYNLASVMVVPSLTENLSCTIMESLSCGTPVVAFNIGGNSDMIEHLSNGYLAHEKDSEDLARGIIWCLENNCDGHLSVNARRKVVENYSPQIVGRQYAHLYTEILQSSKVPLR